jgi:hypothetical protein
MKETPDNTGGSASTLSRDTSVEGRMLRTMALAVALAVIGSLPFASPRVTAGLLLGGLLSLLNHRWLIGSSTAALRVVAHGDKPRLKLVQYILRYAVVGTLVFAAYQLNLVSLTATIIGLSSFVVALFVEAFREFYFAIIHREEIS